MAIAIWFWLTYPVLFLPNRRVASRPLFLRPLLQVPLVLLVSLPLQSTYASSSILTFLDRLAVPLQKAA
jgi:hypothetical protein